MTGKLAKIISLFMAIVLLAGCSPKAPAVEEGAGSDTLKEAAVIQDAFRSTEPFAITEKKWAGALERQGSNNWWTVSDYRGHLFEESEGDWGNYPYSCTDGKSFYVLRDRYYYRSEEPDRVDRVEWYLYKLNGETLECSRTALRFPDLAELEGCTVSGMDAAAGQVMLFLQSWDETRSTKGYYALELGQDGTWGDPVDLMPALMDGFADMGAGYCYGGGKWDSRGYFYLVSDDNSSFAVTDAGGKLLTSIEGISENRETLVCRYKTPEGLCIWEAENSAEHTTTHFFYNDRGVQILAKDPFEFVQQRCVNENGELFFISGDVIVCRNLANGENAKICQGSISSFQRCLGMVHNSKDQLVLMTNEDDGMTVTVYSQSGPAREVEIKVFCTSFMEYVLKNALQEFSRTHPGITFTITERNYQSDTQEGHWNKLMTELAAGTGPDILVLNHSQMKILQEKDVLADLTEVLPREDREQVFQGILDYGSVDGQIYLLPYAAKYRTLMVADSSWPGDTWTIEDALDIMERAGKTGEYPEYFTVGQWFPKAGGVKPLDIFLELTYDLEHSPFLDLEKGTCDFDSPLFIRLLETCAAYGREVVYEDSSEVSDISEAWRILKAGEALVYCSVSGSLIDFSREMYFAGEDYHIVGMPTNSGSGSYWKCLEGLSVNAKSENRDIIDELLRTLHGRKVQMAVSEIYGMVRKDYLTECVKDNVSWSDKAYLYLGNGTYVELIKKPGGGTYLQEYLDFLDSCQADPDTLSEIRAIMEEEAEGFFRGAKDAQQVAEIIQKRVKLYLAE